MKLILENAKQFQKSIKAISNLIDEAEFQVTNEGLFLKATDPSQISMIQYELPKSAFKEFHLEKEETIGLDMDYFNQIMSRAKDGDFLILEKSDNTLFVTFKGKSKRTFSVPLIDIAKGQLPNPKIEFEAEIVLTADVLQDALKDASLVGSHVRLGVEESTFFIRAESSKGSVSNEITANDSTMKSFNASSKNIKATFPLDFLQDMLKAADSKTEIKLYLKTDAPLKLEYKLGDAQIVYFLAPRIEE